MSQVISRKAINRADMRAARLSPRTAALPCICIAILLAGCISPSELAHRNFKNFMQLDIGLSVDDPDAYRNRYPGDLLRSRTLPNGNIEEEFETGRWGRCRVFFEIDNKARSIVGWRYEGSEEDCSIPP